MKKTFLSLAAALVLLGAPAAQAAFVSHPVEVVSNTTSGPAARAEAIEEVTSTEASTVTTKVMKVKKTSFFGKVKNFFAAAGGKSQIVAFFLCWFFGFFGAHRFYLGYTWQGIVQLLTFGGFGIWFYIDFFRVITGNLGPKNGSYDKTF